MKRTLLALTIAACGMGSLSTAQAVALNPDGLGQVLIFPYYTVNGGLTTLLSVANNSDRGKIVQVTFREAYNGGSTIDFNLFLSAYDVWTGAVFSLDASGPANLLTDDKSCTAPDLRAFGNNVLSDGRHYQPFRNYEFTDGGPLSLDRSREGHVELIEMASIAPGSALELAVASGAGGTPHDCSAARAVGADSPALLPPSGDLYGSGSIVDPAMGTLYAYSADAIDGFYTLPMGNLMWGAPVSLAAARTTGTAARAINHLASGSDLVATSDYASLQAIDAVSAVFAANAIFNDYIVEAVSGSESEWVVTFPTKRYYVNGANSPIAPFTKRFSDAASCVKVAINYWDRNSQTSAGSFLDVPPPPVQLCHETQVVTLQKTADYAAGNHVSKVLGSRLTVNVDPRATGFTSGRMALDLDSALEPHALRPSQDGDVFHGLPVTGFLAVNYINGNNNGVLANYSGLYRHHAQRHCTNAEAPCD